MTVLFRSQAIFWCFCISSFGILAGCKSNVPHAYDLRERVVALVDEVQDLREQAADLSTDGDILVSAEDVKWQRETVLALLLDQAEIEMRYIGLSEYTDSTKNTEQYLSLANDVATLSGIVRNQELSNSFDAMGSVNYFMKKFFWPTRNRHFFSKQDDAFSLSMIVHFLTGWATPYVMWGLADAHAFLYDMTASWGFHSEDEEGMALDPALLARLEKLKALLAQRKSLPVDQQQSVATRDKGLSAVFKYSLQGNEDQLKEWAEMSQRNLAPGSHFSGLHLYFYDVGWNYPNYYDDMWNKFVGDVKAWLREFSTGHVTSTFILLRPVIDDPTRQVVTGRVNVELEVKLQQPFIQWFRHFYDVPSEITVNVEALPQEK